MFTDEKLFTVTPPVNLQNDSVYVTVPMRKKKKLQPIDYFVLIQISLNPTWFQSGYQVSAAQISSLLIQGSKLMVHIIMTFYSVSTYSLLELSSGEFFIFQQNNAPAHQARETVDLLSRETPDFISPTFWPPNSPDLNPVDYKIWNVISNPHT